MDGKIYIKNGASGELLPLIGLHKYHVVAQKIYETETTLSWAAIHLMERYTVTYQSYPFIQLAAHNKYVLVCMTIDKVILEVSDGLNSSDAKDYKVFAADSENELYEYYLQLNINPAGFTQHWNCDYPFS